MGYMPRRRDIKRYSGWALEFEELHRRFKARQPLIFVETYDYELLDGMIAKLRERNVIGNVREFVPGVGTLAFATKDIDPMDSLESTSDLRSFLLDEQGDGRKSGDVLLIRGGTRWFETNPESVECLRMIVGNDLNDTSLTTDTSVQSMFLFVVVVGSEIDIPLSLIPYSAKIRLPKPEAMEVEKIVLSELADIEHRIGQKFDLGIPDGAEDGERKRRLAVKTIAERLVGFCESEIRTLLRYAFQSNTYARSWDHISDAKREMVDRTRFLRLEDVAGKDIADTSSFGGLGALRDYLDRVKRIASLPARDRKRLDGYGMKGILLVGMPGCGKTMAAKAAGRILGWPLIQLDIGRLLGKYVGESESRLNMALEIAERAEPCVLWIDELEKAFSGLDSSDGTALRLFGRFLTWLQEKKEKQVYVIATANNIEKIPDEFKRKGRFDEIFCIQLPDREERAEIFLYHLRKVMREADGEALHALAKRLAKRADYADPTDPERRGFSGADISSVVYNAAGDVLVRNLQNGDGETRFGEEFLDMLEDALNLQIGRLKSGKTTQRDVMAARKHISDDGKKKIDGYAWTLKRLSSSGFRPASSKKGK